jgi:cytochrome c oxidase subunit IV
MSERTSDRKTMERRWLKFGALWLVLLTLTGVTLALAYLPLGRANVDLHLAIAAVQILLLWSFFMNLRSASALVRLTAASGMLWLTFMFVLIFTDYLSRG